MDTLKGKQIMVWTFMGNTRMYQALRDYGDRMGQGYPQAAKRNRNGILNRRASASTAGAFLMSVFSGRSEVPMGLFSGLFRARDAPKTARRAALTAFCELGTQEDMDRF